MHVHLYTVAVTPSIPEILVVCILVGDSSEGDKMADGIKGD